MQRRQLLQGGSASLALGPTVAGAAAAPFVVAELFTSQGCSSCPPADALLLELTRRPEVVALAWHVDYWNSLGWRDPYANADWTRRQRQYARLLSSEVFTPALVVNGKWVVVGSDRSAVMTALRATYPQSVDVNLRRSESGLVGRVGPRQETTSVMLVVYDAIRSTGVHAGENLGRTLREGHIVRSAEVMVAARDGADVTGPVIAPDQGAVLLVQERDGSVVGVAEVRPASESPL